MTTEKPIYLHQIVSREKFMQNMVKSHFGIDDETLAEVRSKITMSEFTKENLNAILAGENLVLATSNSKG